jgi:hypothetical protein
MTSSVFWDIAQSSPLKVNRRFGRMFALLATYFMPVSCVAYFSTLKMEVTRSSEMSDDFSANYTALYPRRQRNSSLREADCAPWG